MIKAKSSSGNRQPRPPLVVDALPIALLDEPIEYMFAEHVRQRAVSNALQGFAQAGTASRAEADMVAAFLMHDRIIHHADEDEDLFPVLRRRALPEDGLGSVLARLSEDHRRGAKLVDDIVAVLTSHPDRDLVRISNAAASVMQFYAADEHRHLAIENGVVLAIAGIRLKRRDLKMISHRMKARRGVHT